ncbi:hypothetical protein Q4548_17045, partial [Wenyingzhuangia sp. 2_MG-2023]
ILHVRVQNGTRNLVCHFYRLFEHPLVIYSNGKAVPCGGGMKHVTRLLYSSKWNDITAKATGSFSE